MSDSGRQIGDCRHGNDKHKCLECRCERLERQRGADIDYQLGRFAGLVGRFAGLEEAARIVDAMCESSYTCSVVLREAAAAIRAAKESE